MKSLFPVLIFSILLPLASSAQKDSLMGVKKTRGVSFAIGAQTPELNSLNAMLSANGFPLTNKTSPYFGVSYFIDRKKNRIEYSHFNYQNGNTDTSNQRTSARSMGFGINYGRTLFSGKKTHLTTLGGFN